MKINIKRKSFIDALNVALLAVNKNATLPIIQHVKMDITEEGIRLTGTDLEITSSIFIEGVIDKKGSYMIDGLMVRSILSKLQDEEVVFELSEKNLTIIGFSGNFEIGCIGEAKDFPETPSIKDKLTSLKVDDNGLAEHFKRLINYTGDDEFKPVLTGVCFDYDGTNIHFVGTDAHRLNKRTTNYTLENNEKVRYVIPEKGALLISKLKSDDIKLEFGSNNLFVSANNITHVIRLIDGNYPNYNSVIPQKFNSNVIVHRQTLKDAVDRICLVSNSTTKLVTLSIKEEKLIIEGMDIDFATKGHQELDMEVDEVTDMVLGCNGNFLLSILNSIDEEYVVIKLIDHTKAFLIHPLDEDKKAIEEILYLLMPISINQ